MKKYNTRMCVKAPKDKSGGYKLRVRQYPGRGKRSPYLMVKCGCCPRSVRIYFDKKKEPFGEKSLEINGVFAGLKEWRRLLLPLLK
ncbi:MAG: hypothetical protein AB1599_08290 [Planctomycetota bacterium]